jgi:hypothetical protein
MKAFWTVAGTISIFVTLMLFMGCGGGDSTYSPISGDPPIVTAITPQTGTVGTEFEITGANFRIGAAVFFDTLAANFVEVVSDSSIFGYIPTGVVIDHAYLLTVRNIDGTSGSLEAAFNAVAPILYYVNSATKPSGNSGSTVVLEGDAFGDIQGEGQVLFSDGAGGTISASIDNPDDWTNNFIVTTVPNGAESGDIVVRTATGTSGALTFKVTQNATFSPSAINWTSTTPLPLGVSGHQSSFIPIDDGGTTARYVLVTGGCDDAITRADVNFAAIQPGGDISAWSGTSSLPDPTAFHATVVATPFNSKVNGEGYVYCIGGINEIGAQPASVVYRAPINVDGSLGAWSLTSALPIPLQSHGAVIFLSSIYVAGGATNDNQPVSAVYRADIDSTGDLSAWQIMTSLPSDRTYHGLTVFGNYLHTFGGESAPVSPDDGNYTSNNTKLDEVTYIRIDLRTGNLASSSWSSNSASLTKRVSKHTALIAGGNVLITAGLYNGAGSGSSENSYAQMFSDGSTGSFHGATGSITIVSQGGGNLFNHSALSYVDADGVAHVMVLGGNDVNNPGTKRAGVWYY